MIDVGVREFKRPPLDGGTLIVSVPDGGVGNIVATDFLLDELDMDQIAAVDSSAFPPIAMMRAGKPRFAMRIHAAEGRRLAVLRSEFAPHPALARPIAQALLAWAKERDLHRVIALEAFSPADAEEPGEPRLAFAGSVDATRHEFQAAGLPELADGALAGVAAMLLLEGRMAGADVGVLLAEVRSPVDDIRSVLAFLDALGSVAPVPDLDVRELERDVERTEGAVRHLREEAERALGRLSTKPSAPSFMYG